MEKYHKAGRVEKLNASNCKLSYSRDPGLDFPLGSQEDII